MASIHIHRARSVAESKGAASAQVSIKLWDLSKREIIEVALHLAALSTDSYDEAMQDGDKGEGRFWEEYAALKSNRLI